VFFVVKNFSRKSAFTKKFHELFQFRACGPAARNGAEERGQFGQQFFVFQNVIWDAARIHGGIIEEFIPVVRARLEAKLFGPFAKGVFVARRLEDFAFDLAPIAGVVAVLQTKLAQAEPSSRPQFFDEYSKHRF